MNSKCPFCIVWQFLRAKNATFEMLKSWAYCLRIPSILVLVHYTAVCKKNYNNDLYRVLKRKKEKYWVCAELNCSPRLGFSRLSVLRWAGILFSHPSSHCQNGGWWPVGILKQYVKYYVDSVSLWRKLTVVFSSEIESFFFIILLCWLFVSVFFFCIVNRSPALDPHPPLYP